MPTSKVVLNLVVIILILIACYYATYYISKKASGQSGSKYRNRYINLIGRFSISRDKSFCLVEIAGKVYVLGVTNQSITLIDSLDAAAFQEAAAERHDMESFTGAPAKGSMKGLTNRLAAYMAGRMGRTPDNTGVPGGKSFADNMDKAERDAKQNAEQNAGGVESHGIAGQARNDGNEAQQKRESDPPDDER